MKIIAGVSQYSKGSNKELAEKFVANVESYFKKEFPNGWFNGGLRNGLGADHIVFSFGMNKEVKVTPHNDPMYHSVIIQWGDGFGNQSKTLEQGAELTLSANGGIHTNPAEGSFMAMDRVKTKLTNVKKGGSLDKFDKKFKTFMPKLRKLFDEHKHNLYRVEDINPKYLK